MIYSIKVIADGMKFTVGEKNPLDSMGMTTVEKIIYYTPDYDILISDGTTVSIVNSPCYVFTKEDEEEND